MCLLTCLLADMLQFCVLTFAGVVCLGLDQLIPWLYQQPFDEKRIVLSNHFGEYLIKGKNGTSLCITKCLLLVDIHCWRSRMDVVGNVFGLWSTLCSCSSLSHLCCIRPGETLFFPDPEMCLIKKMCWNSSILALEFCVVILCSLGLNFDFRSVQG